MSGVSVWCWDWVPPSWKSKNSHISAVVCVISTKFGTMVQFSPLGDRPLTISNFKNPRWRRPPSWKIEKSPYLGRGSTILTQFGTMMHFEPLDHPDRQKFEILQIQDGGGCHLENRNIAISQPRFSLFRRNLVRLCRSTLLSVLTIKNFKFRKSKMAATAILKNWIIAISRPRFNRFLTQFGTMMHFEPLDRPDRQKFELLQIQDGGGRHLENRNIAISQPRFSLFRRNLVRLCRSTLLGVPTVKNLKFR